MSSRMGYLLDALDRGYRALGMHAAADANEVSRPFAQGECACLARDSWYAMLVVIACSQGRVSGD